MGDAVVSALVKEVVGRLTSVAIQEFGLLWGFIDDILTLKDDFEQVQIVLQDAEENHKKEKDVDLWLKSLMLESMEVENVLDEVSTEAMIQRLHKQRGIKYRVRAFFSANHNQLMFRLRIARKIKAIRRKLDAIKSKRFELSLTPSAISHVGLDIALEIPNRETSSLIHDSSIIFGRNEEIEMVTRKICNKDIGKYDNGEIRVHCIWGMGGVGKTTLAQLVYNHERVNQYFELKCWVYVSEKFQVIEIIKKIMESIDKYECKLTQLDTLQDSLQNKLRGKKFIIVLDDVWIEENEKTKWEELSKTLSCGAEGSIVVITTRSNKTSRMMAKVHELQHELGCLSEEDSWLLFKKFAFAQGREGDDITELEPIGREIIVEKCKGLPLAVKTLASLLWSKNSTSDWQLVKRSNIWELKEDNILPALKISYDNLLPHLRRCFAYCCLFPKGQEMEKDVVIQLWVSNGFIPPRGEISLYVLGEESFNCLVWRSFFQVVVKDCRYKIHDLMHDMARHVMRHECLVIESGKEVIFPNNVLHLSLSCPDFRFSPQNLRKITTLRSIFMNGEMNEGTISQIFNHVRLRVLYLCGIGLRTLPESICKLKYLKYLNLSYLVIEVLPDSVIYLQNLQVLLLCFCVRLRKLPEGLRYMTNLQRLDINSCSSLLYLPFGIKELTSLRMLPLFPIRHMSGAKIGELGNLNLLEGELEISGLEDIEGFDEAKSANLKCKRNLMVLGLNWSDKYYMRKSELGMFANDEEVIEGLEPNMCLKGLKISHYMGKIISPSWMINLINLVETSFFYCENCEHIPQLGRLPNLRVINLRVMDSLKSFHDDGKNMSGDANNMFLCLQELNIVKCPNLVSLPSILPKLKVLRLVECDRLLYLPDEIGSFKDLNKIVIFRCQRLNKRCEKEKGVDWPKISHIPNISTEYPW